MNFSKSAELYARALKVTPMGAQTMSKAPGRVGPIGAFPLSQDRAVGPYIWDEDGNQFTDWLNGNCAVIAGHRHEFVNWNVKRMIDKQGGLPSLPTSLEAEVAEQLVELIPCAEQVRFLKTGSEATEAAIRIARMATGRDVIAVIPSQYNGWHSWSVARCELHPGVPPDYGDLLETRIRYNDVDSLNVLDFGHCAAIIIEPTTGEPPSPGFLEAVNREAHETGTLVIHDNMIVGMRWSIAGSDYFGVQPDLACYGKAFANGFPLAFVCGPADLMKHAAVVSGTYGGEVTGLAACQAVLSVMNDERIAQLWQIGQALMDGFNGTAQRLKLPVVMESYACRPKVRWTVDTEQLPYVIALFQQELAANGILAHPSGWNPSLAHEGTPLLATLRGVTLALTTAASYLADGDLASHLRGELLKPAFGRTT